MRKLLLAVELSLMAIMKGSMLQLCVSKAHGNSLKNSDYLLR